MLAVALLALASTAGADQQRERPWPDEWPIILPPNDGPPPAEPRVVRGSTPSATNAAIADELGRISRRVRRTRYQHRLRVREGRGIYFFDCSLMVQWVLGRRAPASVTSLRRFPRALARHFAGLIERAPTRGSRRGWRRIERVAEARAGDVFAWRRPDGFPSRNTGHVGFVVGIPQPVSGLPGAYAVRVVDATGTPHQRDTRPQDSEGGFGSGTIVFLTDAQGRGTHYGWYGTRSGGYVTTPILFGRVVARPRR